MEKNLYSGLKNGLGCEYFTYSSGKAKGVSAVRMFNGVLDFVVLLDKCMNIYRASHKGENLAYINDNGVVSPMLASSGAYPFTSYFDGGLLYMCGLDNIASPTDGTLQHGSMSLAPCENAHTEYSVDGNELTLYGTMNFTALFGTNVTMKRQITISCNDKNSIAIVDTIINNSALPFDYYLLYHINLGYPFLNKDIKIGTDKTETYFINARSENEPTSYNTFDSPNNKDEAVYCHKLHKGKAYARNKTKEFAIDFNIDNLPYLVVWKNETIKDYVLGIEPSSSTMPNKTKRTISPRSFITNNLLLSIKEI